MRRFRAILAGLLSVWLPIDAAVAGWWHHHHALPLVHGPMPVAPCGAPPAPWAGWEHAVVIDDRPLFAPAPVVVAPVIEVFHPVAPLVVEHPVHEEVIVAGYDIGGVVADACTCDTSTAVVGVPFEEGTPLEGAPVDSYEWTTDVRPDDAREAKTAPMTDVIETSKGVETKPEPPVAPPAEPLPTEKAPPAVPAPLTVEKPADDVPASVLEPREPATLQGTIEKSEAETFTLPATDEPTEEEPAEEEAPLEEPMEETEGFEPPADEATDEPMDEVEVVKEPAAPAKGATRNLFDEAPAADDFGAPADDDAGIPEAPPMDEGFEAPADEAPLDDVPADDMPMEEAPADDDGFEAPADEDAPMDDDVDAQTEETPADETPAADPFDSSLRVPAAPTRTWQDDSGRFSTEGRLVEIRAGSVRILKTTGRHTTVPMDRLSDADRDHVAGVWRILAARRPWTGDTAGLR